MPCNRMIYYNVSLKFARKEEANQLGSIIIIFNPLGLLYQCHSFVVAFLFVHNKLGQGINYQEQKNILCLCITQTKPNYYCI